MIKRFLEAGVIIGAHGIKGELRVMPWSDGPDFLTNFKEIYFDNGKTKVNIISARVNKKITLLQLDGVDTVSKADILRNKVIFIDRNEVTLPKGSYYVQDLIDLKVIDADSNKEYGKLCEVSQTGANDVYHIKDENGKIYLIPAVKEMVIKTDIENGCIYIRPIKGIFDDED
jgi:16S rRNA processing protein RimM